MMLFDLIAVACGGVIGTLARFLLSRRLNARHRADNNSFPWGTFAVNGIGCLCLGIVVCVAMPAELLAFIVPGVLGSFTTFSTWMVEVVKIGKKSGLRGIWYLCITLVAGIVAFLAGVATGQLWIRPEV